VRSGTGYPTSQSRAAVMATSLYRAMTKHANPNRRWDRVLPLEDCLALIESVHGLLGRSDDKGVFTATLEDTTAVKAKTIEELRADLIDVRDSDVLDLIAGIGHDSGTFVFLRRRDGMALDVEGDDHTLVFGVFARLERAIERAFKLIDETPDGDTANSIISVESVNVGAGNVDIGSPVTGSAQIVSSGGSGSGPLSRQSAPTPSVVTKRQPWENPWVVTVGGGVIVAVVVALLLGH
jgi:hypothetical protein